MIQQINLYQPIFRKQRKVFSAVTLAQIVAVFALGMAAIYGISRWNLERLESDVVLLEAQQVNAQAQFDQLTRELAAQRDDSGLSTQIEQAETELAARQQLLKWLGERGSERQPGFSGHLAGLARQHRGELWLESIQLGQSGQSVTLEGGSQNADAVVRYLRRLGAEPAFSGLEFRSVKIERNDKAPGELHFRVSNVEAPTP